MNLELKSNKIVLGNKENTQRKVYMLPGVHEARVVEFRDWNTEEIEAAKERVENAKKHGEDKELVPFIVMTIEDETTGAKFTNRFYMGSSSNKYNKAKIGHIVAVLCPGCNLAEMNETDIIADGIVGKMGRFKIIGEEAISRRGQSYSKAKSFPSIKIYDGDVHGFCERIDTPTSLTFDWQNPNDFKRLPTATVPTEQTVTEAGGNDDNPF